jgi:hypothetical protein
MNRYVLADILGTGEADVDEFRPAVADYPVGWKWSGSAPNVPKQGGTVLVEVTSGDVSPMIGDDRIDMLPTCPLSTPATQIDAGEMAVMRAALDRRNMGIAINMAGTYGDIIAVITLRANVEGTVPTRAELTL